MKAIIAPIYVDALVLSHPKVVKDALADFTRLPYSDTHNDYNSDTPYVGEAMLNHAFQDKNLTLAAGTHIHWSLPFGLTKTVGFPALSLRDLNPLDSYFEGKDWGAIRQTIWDNLLIDTGWIKRIGNIGTASILPMEEVNATLFDANMSAFVATAGLSEESAENFTRQLSEIMNTPMGSRYPAVPDVWVVSRIRDEAVDRLWIVESGFIATERSSAIGNERAVNIPFHDDKRVNKSIPFRYMGRQQVLDATWKRAPEERYLDEVTAVGYNPQEGTKGYGEPTFAAFYPNCMSVFGCYDPDVTSDDAGVRYEVMGYYNDPENDYFYQFIYDFANRNARDEDFLSNLTERIKTEFLWELPEEATTTIDDLPKGTVLFGKTYTKTATPLVKDAIKVAVGNTGTEALSSFLNSAAGRIDHQVEEILESVQLTSRLQNQSVDIGYTFRELRHEKGFTAFPGGNLWQVKVESKDGSTATENADDATVAIPPEINALISEANKRQFEYDRMLDALPAAQRQLFSDWYKYMLSAYPPADNTSFYFDSDQLIDYIRNEGIPAVQEALLAQGTLRVNFNESGQLVAAQTPNDTESTAGKLVSQLNELLAAVEAFNASLQAIPEDVNKHVVIRQSPAPRYWRANDPVVLFAEDTSQGGTSLLQNNRHAEPYSTETTLCAVGNFDAPETISFQAFATLVISMGSAFSTVRETGKRNDPTIFNPFMLEWEVSFHATQPGKNDIDGNQAYATDYITRNFELLERSADFSLETHYGVKDVSSYTGSTILTPAPLGSLTKSIDGFLEAHGDAQSQATVDALNLAKQQLKTTAVLAQAMSGFHEALLMQKQTRQLDVADPLGFEDYQRFTSEEVAPLVGKMNLTAPDPLSEFNPIRSGELAISQLRLIDSFGQTLDFEGEEGLIVSEPLKNPENGHPIMLLPRFSQPARVNFRLLSANDGTEEMNSHPDSSPICGWLLPNLLDRSLMVYDQHGGAIGAITLNAANPWFPAPDAALSTDANSISNIHLRDLVHYILKKQLEDIEALESTEGSYIEQLLKATESALEHVEPENFAEHQDLALLMGRPIAVVRSKINLELNGAPFTDQSWSHLAEELNGQGRSTDGYSNVKIPLRLGEHYQVNDGILGYWIEENNQLGNTYFSSEASPNTHPNIETFEDGGPAMNLYQSFDDDPITVTMLVDPRGDLHVTTGVLPVKSITIPKAQYTDALKNIAVTFRTAPVLSGGDHLKISLPVESGYDWQWIERSLNGQWTEIPQTVIVTRSLFDSSFTDQIGLWDDLVERGWLVPTENDPDRAIISTKVHRAFPPNETAGDEAFPAAIGQRIDAFFDTHGKRIEPFELDATLNNNQKLREGWLELIPRSEKK